MFTSCHQLVAAVFVFDDAVVVLDETSGVPAEVVLKVAQSAGNIRGFELGCSTTKPSTRI